MVALGVLAGASAVVSYAAQYRMVLAAKAVAPVAALEAGIPDVAALIFASLGIALALHGRRAIRARVLNVGAVATSVTMNVLAAGHGWRDLAIWAMPPIAYALASDTAIGVVRAWTIARQKALNEALADEGTTPLAIIGGLAALGPAPDTGARFHVAGFRRWVLEECPVAPGRRAGGIAPGPGAGIALRNHRGDHRPPDSPKARPWSRARDQDGSVSWRWWPSVTVRCRGFPLASVSRVCSELAPEADLDLGAARTALRRHVQAARNGSAS